LGLLNKFCLELPHVLEERVKFFVQCPAAPVFKPIVTYSTVTGARVRYLANLRARQCFAIV
jgi:hypothetical protein